MSDRKKALRDAYDGAVAEREGSGSPAWKVNVRQSFLDLIRNEHKRSLLELGAGTGVHGQFFSDHGMAVTSTDLSAAMVTACQQKGLNAVQMDFTELQFADDSFDVVYALNCLLHASPDELQLAIAEVGRVLQSGGLFYWGQYGGEQFEGTLPTDNYQPKRYFSFLDDATLQQVAGSQFSLVSFDRVEVSHHWNQYFQSSVWRR